MTSQFPRTWLLAALAVATLASNAFAAESIDIFPGVSDDTPNAGDTIQVDVTGNLTVEGDTWSSTGMFLADAGGNPVVSSAVCVNQPEPNRTAPPGGQTYLEVIDFTIPADLPGGTYNIWASGYRTGENCDGDIFTGTFQDFYEITVLGGDLALSLPFPAPTTKVAGETPDLDIIIGLDKTGGISEGATVDFGGSTLPAGVEITGATGAAVAGFAGGVVDIVAIGDGAQINFTIQVAVASSAADGAVIQLVAVAENDTETDPDPSNNTLNVPDITVARQVNLVMAITENNADPIVAGQGSTDYTYEIENLGPSDASGVGAQLTVVTTGTFVEDPACAYDDPFFVEETGVWPVGNLASGASLSLGETCGVGIASTDGANREATMAVAFVDETVIVPEDDSATEDTTVTAVSDLTLLATSTPPATFVAGAPATLSVAFTLSQAGGVGEGATVDFTGSTLPNGVEIVSVLGPDVLGFAGGVVDIDVLGAGASTSFTVNLVVASNAADGDVISLVGVAASDTAPDINPDDNTVTVPNVEVVREYDLALAVVDSPDPVLAGSGDGNLTHTFTLSRSGPSDASGVSVAITPSLPSGVTIVGSGADVGNFDGSTWTIPDINVQAADNGTVGTLNIVLTVDYTAASCTDCISATGTVSATDGGTDTDGGNDTAVDPTSIEAPADLTTYFATSINFLDTNTSSYTATLSCNTGLPLTQPFDISEGAGVDFTMTQLPFTTPGTQCEITIEDIGDYAVTAVANGGAAAASCKFAVTDTTNNFNLEGQNTCVFTASADDATYTVLKDWVFDGTGGDVVDAVAAVTIQCNAMIDGCMDGYYPTKGGSGLQALPSCPPNVWYDSGYWYKTGDLGDGDTLVATVDVSGGKAKCSATEDIQQSGVESSSNEACTDEDLVAGESATCVFTNTVFFEGIPTLSQYGLALMALLMLGVGFVGMRRFV